MSESKSRYLIYVFLAVVGISLGMYMMYQWMNKDSISIEEQSNVLLEKINTVTKLVTVEGVFSEIYEHKNTYTPQYLPFSFTKKALIIVKAKVSVGYDLEKMEIEMNTAERVIYIKNVPEPEIISIDHDLQYYDIQESSFNTFSKEDYTQLNAAAKRFIEEKAKEGDLFVKAEEQGNQMLQIIEFMAEEAGFSVEYEYRIKDSILNEID